ncbi:MAG: sodium transporter, partial [Ginsengibacter sp.]
MGLSFLFTMIIMVAISLGGPKINPKAFELDKSMFKLRPQTILLIILTLLLISALYVKFW